MVFAVLLTLGLLGLGLLVTVMGLLAATRTPPEVPRTVLDDAARPRLRGAGVTLHGRVLGPQGAPLVIALHGGPGSDHRSLQGLEALTDSHRVLVFDQRGAGLSERVAAERLGIEAHLADLDQLITDHAQGAPVALLGHSMGAALAVAYLGYRPERIARAVLIEPGFLDPAGYEAFEARRRRLARSPRVIWAGIVAGFRARGVTGDPHAARDSILGAAVHAFANHPRNPYHCGEGYTAPSWRFGGLASDTFWADVTPTLDAIAAGLGYQGPVLFMAGACNSWIGPELQRAHAARFADARLETVPNAGHDVIWDQPAEALRRIRAFLRR